MEKKPILLIGALRTELEYLISKLENCEEEKNSVYHFYKGTIKGYPIVIAKSEVGLVNASSCLTLAIEKYDPICIVNSGTAGGITGCSVFLRGRLCFYSLFRHRGTS